MRLPITPCKATGSDEGYSENKMSSLVSQNVGKRKMHSVIFCIFCIFVLFMTAYGTVLVYENGASTRSNGLKYQNGSLGSTTNGTVSLDMEQVWLYKYFWPNKTRVSKSYFHCCWSARLKIRGFYNMKSFKARILMTCTDNRFLPGLKQRPHSTGEEHRSRLHR